MKVTYQEYLDQKANGTWKDTITRDDIKWIQDPTCAEFMDELTYLRALQKTWEEYMRESLMPISREIPQEEQGYFIIGGKEWGEKVIAQMKK